MSIPQPDLFTNPNDLQRNTLQLQTRIVQIAWTDSWKIWNPGSSQIRPRFWHKYSWKWVLWANGQTGGGAKSALALDWIDLERFWQCKSLNWHLCESKKVCKYGATMHIEGSRSLWRKNYLSGGVRSSNWLSSQLENLTRVHYALTGCANYFELLWYHIIVIQSNCCDIFFPLSQRQKTIVAWFCSVRSSSNLFQ